MTYHGGRFCAGERGGGREGRRRFEKRLVGLGIRRVPAGVNRPQTDGSLERIHGEIQRKLHEFGSVTGEEHHAR